MISTVLFGGACRVATGSLVVATCLDLGLCRCGCSHGTVRLHVKKHSLHSLPEQMATRIVKRTPNAVQAHAARISGSIKLLMEVDNEGNFPSISIRAELLLFPSRRIICRAMGYLGIECENRALSFSPHHFPIPNDSPTPTEANPAAFACPVCGHVYWYRTRQYFSSPYTNPQRICVVVKFDCDEAACAIPITVYSTRLPSEDFADVETRLRRSNFHLRCARGHPVYFPPIQSRHLSVQDYR